MVAPDLQPDTCEICCTGPARAGHRAKSLLWSYDIPRVAQLEKSFENVMICYFSPFPSLKAFPFLPHLKLTE